MAALQVEMEGQTSSHRTSVGETLDPYWLYAVDPLVLLLRSRCRDSVKCVVSLNDAAIRLRLAGFDHLIFVVWDEELETVLTQSRRNGSGICGRGKTNPKEEKKQSSADPGFVCESRFVKTCQMELVSVTNELRFSASGCVHIHIRSILWLLKSHDELWTI